MSDCTPDHNLGLVIENAKPKRIVDPDLLAVVRQQPCLACFTTPCDADHLTTRGAGGDDVAENVWSLCRHHHQVRHQHGLKFMVENFPACLNWLELAGRVDILARLGLIRD